MQQPSSQQPIRVGIAGFGNVGREIARRLDAGGIAGMAIGAITSGDLEKARRNAAHLTGGAAVVTLDELARRCEVVVECATAHAFPTIARAALGAGRILIAVSAAGVPSCPELVDLARAHGGRAVMASGALPGLDAIRAAAEGNISKVGLRTQLRPESLAHEEAVLRQGLDFTTPPHAPVRVFEGTAWDAAAAFPRHFNVAITLSLAAIGFERTRIEVWADPTVPGTVHTVSVESEDVDLTLISRNRPSPTNPRTSRMVSHSVMAALRTVASPLQVGS